MIDPLDIGPEGAREAREVADRSDRSMLWLRICALLLVVSVGVMLLALDAGVHALWMLPTLPLFFNADFRLGGTAEAYRAVAVRHEGGTWETASVNDILRGTYRHEFYALLTLAVLAVAIRG